MTTSGLIAHNCCIKGRGGNHCVEVCNIVISRKGSRFGPKMCLRLTESKNTMTPRPPGLVCKALHNCWHTTMVLHKNPCAEFESYAM